MMGGGRFNEKNVKMMMKKMGISTTDIPDVEEVIILTKDKEYHIKMPQVTVIETKDVKTYQVIGTAEERNREKNSYAQEDIDLVKSQTGVADEVAIKALKESDGMPAEAIDKILNKKLS